MKNGMKSGYYWVKWNKNSPWIVVEYSTEDGWCIPADYDLPDGSFYDQPEIRGQYIPYPKD